MSAEFDVLTRALRDTGPACAGDDRFTADDTEPADVADVCASCSVFELCAAYADADEPEVGIWAGRSFGKRPRRASSNPAAARIRDEMHAALAEYPQGTTALVLAARLRVPESTAHGRLKVLEAEGRALPRPIGPQARYVWTAVR